jgi:hypothetical protein
MPQRLEHRQIQGLVSTLADAKIVDLDASIRTLIEPLAAGLRESGAGGEVSLHVLCCNEYFLVTGLTDPGGEVAEFRQLGESIRTALSQSGR